MHTTTATDIPALKRMVQAEAQNNARKK
jgi:hypothetical protein